MQNNEKRRETEGSTKERKGKEEKQKEKEENL